MSTIRPEGPETRPSTRAPRTENLKDSEAVTAATSGGTGQVAEDRVHLPAKLEEGLSRVLPDLGAWGDKLTEAASGVADRIADAGHKIWDTVSEAAGLSEGEAPAGGGPPANSGPLTESQPAQAVSSGGAQTAETGANPGSVADPGATPTQAKSGETAATSTTGADQTGPTANQHTLQGLPPRPEDARSGKEFMDSIKNLKPGPERDKAILDEVLKGNIPDGSRDLKEVTVNRQSKDGQSHELTMHVMPDYLSIGSDQDNVRIPMTPAVAQAIADKTGTSLPTDRMVDDIAAKSRKLHLDPFQWKPGNEHAKNMQSVDYYQQHDARIDAQLGTGQAQTDLVSGHKKDLVIPAKDGQVAIYGGYWPGTENRVQPYSNKHEGSYEDYSHGARLVSQEITIDGRTMQLSEALADPNLAPLVTRFPPTANGQPAGMSNHYKVPDRLQ